MRLSRSQEKSALLIGNPIANLTALNHTTTKSLQHKDTEENCEKGGACHVQPEQDSLLRVQSAIERMQTRVPDDGVTGFASHLRVFK